MTSLDGYIRHIIFICSCHISFCLLFHSASYYRDLKNLCNSNISHGPMGFISMTLSCISECNVFWRTAANRATLATLTPGTECQCSVEQKEATMDSRIQSLSPRHWKTLMQTPQVFSATLMMWICVCSFNCKALSKQCSGFALQATRCPSIRMIESASLRQLTDVKKLAYHHHHRHQSDYTCYRAKATLIFL